MSSKLLEDTIAALDIGARLEISRVTRGGISATKVDVYANGEKDLPREVFWEQRDLTLTMHDHNHGHDHLSRRIPRKTTMTLTHHGRSLTEIRRIIEKAPITRSARTTAIRIFEALGEAEAEIHATAIERVQFHEVGAVDAMVDIVCAAVGPRLWPSTSGYARRSTLAAAPSSARMGRFLCLRPPP